MGWKYRNTVVGADIEGIVRSARPCRGRAFVSWYGHRSRPIPVIMCAWQRPERMATTLRLLAAQDNRGFELVVWCNNRAILADVLGAVAKTRAPFGTTVWDSPVNIGGFSRFYCARAMRREGRPHVIFIDDDAEFGPAMVSTFLREAAPKKITSSFGTRFHKGWGNKTYKVSAGSPLDWAGTGLMCADASIFSDPELYQVPKEYWFLEDVWLSYYAKVARKWRLEKSHNWLRLIHDTRGLFQARPHRILYRMIKDLRARGWNC